MKKLVLIPALFAAATVGTAFAQTAPQDPDADENSQDGVPATAESTDDAAPNTIAGCLRAKSEPSWKRSSIDFSRTWEAKESILCAAPRAS